jgi:hypothetical protein
VDIALTIAPARTKAVPVQTENPEGRAGVPVDAAAISREKNPKRATTNPNPIIANPVRIQASNIRSAAKYIRGSLERLCAALDREPYVPLRGHAPHRSGSVIMPW